MIQSRVVHQIDKDLSVARVAAARGNADGAADVRAQAKFVAHVGAVAHKLVSTWTPALNDKIWDDAVEGQPRVVPVPGEAGKSLDGCRCLFRIQLELKLSTVHHADASAGKTDYVFEQR